MSQCTGQVLQTEVASDRRSQGRERIIFRVGLLIEGASVGFCLVKNISSTGAQVKLYGDVDLGSNVTLQIADDEPVRGRIAWIRDDLAGITFEQAVAPEALLRAAQKLAPTKRRSTPRVKTSARVVLRTDGKIYAASLCDISTSGAKIRTFRPAKLGTCASITIPDFPPMKTYVRWSDETHVGLTFDRHLPLEVLSEWLAGRLHASA